VCCSRRHGRHPGVLAAAHKLFARLYAFYSRKLLPLSAARSQVPGGLRLFAGLGARRFPAAEELARDMRAAGFREVTFERLTAGIVALHLGLR